MIPRLLLINYGRRVAAEALPGEGNQWKRCYDPEATQTEVQGAAYSSSARIGVMCTGLLAG